MAYSPVCLDVIFGQMAQPWKLRTVAREAARKEVANSELRRRLAYDKSSKWTDVRIGGSALFYTAANRKSAPRWGGPIRNLGICDTGVTVTFPSQTFEAARYCVGKKAEGQGVEEV